MRTVSIDDVGSEVDTLVGQQSQIATILAQEELLSLRQMRCFGSFGTAMEAHHEDVHLLAQLANDASDGGRVGVHDGVGVMAKGAEAYLQRLFRGA